MNFRYSNKWFNKWTAGGIGALAAIVAIGWGVWTYFFPTPRAFRETASPPDLRYVVISGANPTPVPLKLRVKAAKRKEISISMTALLVINSGQGEHSDPVRISVDRLSAPIFDVEVIPYNFPAFLLESCTGTPLKPSAHDGHRDFCIQVTKLPVGGAISILLLFDQRKDPPS